MSPGGRNIVKTWRELFGKTRFWSEPSRSISCRVFEGNEVISTTSRVAGGSLTLPIANCQFPFGQDRQSAIGKSQDPPATARWY